MFMQENNSVLIKLVYDTYVSATGISLFWEANMAAEKLIIRITTNMWFQLYRSRNQILFSDFDICVRNLFLLFRL